MTENPQPRIQSFSVTQDKTHVLDHIKEMAEREHKSKSYVIIRSVEYYWNKKGANPQSYLFKPKNPPANIVALEEARLRQAMVFLRFHAHMSFRSTGQIVGKSKSFVRRFCKSLGRKDIDTRRQAHKNKRSQAFKKNLAKYQTRFQEWLEGKYGSVEEVFKW